MKWTACGVVFVLVILGAVSVSCAPSGGQVQTPSARDHEGTSLVFASDLNPAYRLLEDLQRIAYERDPEAFRWTESTEQVEQFEEIVGTLGGDEKAKEELIRSLRTAPSTRFEDPVMLYITRYVRDQVARAEPRITALPIGTLPLGTLNARALAVPGAEYPLIVIHTGAYEFCYELVKIALETIEYELTDEGLVIRFDPETSERRCSDPSIKWRLGAALNDYAGNKPIRSFAVVHPQREYLASTMALAMEVFVIGHEYGHVALGHTQSRLHPFSLRGVPASAKVIARSWGEEAAADVYGYLVLTRVLDEIAMSPEYGSGDISLREFARLAPILFFVLAEIAEEAKYIAANGRLPDTVADEYRAEVVMRLMLALDAQKHGVVRDGDLDDETHPPDWARKVLMQRQWEVTVPRPDDMEPMQQKLVLMTVAIMNNIQNVWEDMKPAWVEAHRS